MSGRKTKSKTSKAPRKGQENPLFQARPRNFGIGGAIQPPRDLSRFVKWPKYVRLQRSRRILQDRLRVPAAVNQFNLTLDKNSAVGLFKLLDKYRPETKQEKRERQMKVAEAQANGQEAPATKKPVTVKYGLNHITALVEQKKAKLVVIAHDVDPIELVLWLPALCIKMGVPYVIVKGKSRLGQVVHKKTATALALTEVHSQDKAELAAVLKAIETNFTENYQRARLMRGQKVMGIKAQHKEDKRQKALAREAASKARL